MKNLPSDETLDVIFRFLSELGIDAKPMQDLYRSLQLVQNQVILTGGKGKVTLSIDIENLGNPGDVLLGFDASVSESLPKKKSASKMFYVTEDGHHSRDDPGQIRIPFEEAPEKSTTVIKPGVNQ